MPTIGTDFLEEAKVKRVLVFLFGLTSGEENTAVRVDKHFGGVKIFVSAIFASPILYGQQIL